MTWLPLKSMEVMGMPSSWYSASTDLKTALLKNCWSYAFERLIHNCPMELCSPCASLLPRLLSGALPILHLGLITILCELQVHHVQNA